MYSDNSPTIQRTFSNIRPLYLDLQLGKYKLHNRRCENAENSYCSGSRRSRCGRDCRPCEKQEEITPKYCCLKWQKGLRMKKLLSFAGIAALIAAVTGVIAKLRKKSYQ